MIAFVFALMFLYLGATELIKAKKSKGEVIVFPRTKMPRRGREDIEGSGGMSDTEAAKKEKAKDEVTIQRQTAIFHWQDVCYDVQIKKETRRILDHVDGWVKPGTLTALMVSLNLEGEVRAEHLLIRHLPKCTGSFWSW
jgi:ATP-binding cassette subfamily G (WHITE) protein 2 (PDR)